VAPDVSFVGFGILVTLGSFSVTLFDSATDGLAIDITPRSAQGQVQGIMVASRAGAFILLSLAFGRLVQRFGYGPVFPAIGMAMLVPLFWVLPLREPPERRGGQAFAWSAFRELGRAQFLWFAAYAVIYSVGSFGVDGLVTYYMSEDLGAVETTIGQYGALRGLGAVLGALAGGLIWARLRKKRVALAAALLVSVCAGLFAIAPSVRIVLPIGLLWGAIWALQETVFFALAMQIADARIAASMFAIMMGISNLGSAVADGVATALSDDLGFRTVLLLLGAVNLLTPIVLSAYFHKSPDDLAANKEAV
jgi:predicted MFS family arabinose efflux permease